MEWYGSGHGPSGINIPNYPDIKDNEGFKNLIIEDNEKKLSPFDLKNIIPHLKDHDQDFNINSVKAIARKL